MYYYNAIESHDAIYFNTERPFNNVRGVGNGKITPNMSSSRQQEQQQQKMVSDMDCFVITPPLLIAYT